MIMRYWERKLRRELREHVEEGKLRPLPRRLVREVAAVEIRTDME